MINNTHPVLGEPNWCKSLVRKKCGPGLWALDMGQARNVHAQDPVTKWNGSEVSGMAAGEPQVFLKQRKVGEAGGLEIVCFT